jgi:hypothetical protein
MAKQPDAFVHPVEERSYRCPGCGELVDSSRMEQVLKHHQHIVRQHYRRASLNNTPHARHTATHAATQPTSTQRGTSANAFNGEAAERQRRRYGH